MQSTIFSVKVDSNNLFDLLEQLNEFENSGCKSINFDLSDYGSARSIIMSTISAYIASRPWIEVKMDFPEDADVHHYMTRMKFYEANGLSVPYPFTERPSSGRFVELKKFNEKTQNDVLNKLIACLDRYGISEDMQRIFSFIFAELIDNACSHSESEYGGMICAQMYPKWKELHIAIVDRGVGIPRSLSATPDCRGLSDEEIILKSVQKNVSSKLKANRNHCGIGLYRINTIAQRCRGKLSIYSKKGLLQTENGDTIIKRTDAGWDGTIIHVAFKEQDPEKWERIFYELFPEGRPDVPHLDQDSFF